MSHKITVCITETLQRNVDEIDCEPIEYVRNQYHDEEIILNSSDLVETEFSICD